MQVDRQGTDGRLELEPCLLDSAQLDRAGRDLCRRPREVPAWADVMSQVSIENGRVLILRAALQAPARIRRVAERRLGLTQIRQTIVDDLAVQLGAQAGHEGVVRVEHHHRLVRNLTQRLAPVQSDSVQLSISIQLIAEKVSKD